MPSVHVTTAGVFVEKAGIFKQYVDLYDVPINMFSVFQQFGNLFGLTKLSGIDYRMEQLFSEYPDFAHHKASMGFGGPLTSRANQMREGVMISDPNLIFTHGDIPTPTAYLKTTPHHQQAQNLPKRETKTNQIWAEQSVNLGNV